LIVYALIKKEETRLLLDLVPCTLAPRVSGSASDSDPRERVVGCVGLMSLTLDPEQPLLDGLRACPQFLLRRGRR